MSTNVSRRLARVLSTATVVLIVGGLAAAPAFAEPDPPATSEAPVPTPEPPPASESPAPTEPVAPTAPAVEAAQPDLKLTAAVEPGVYVVNQEIPVNVTVTNNGEGVAKGVLGSSYSIPGSDSFVSTDSSGWRDFSVSVPGQPFPAPGGTIESGASVDFLLKARVSTKGEADAQLKIYVENPDELNREDNEFVLTVPVVSADVTGTIGGNVYGDANDNNVADPGEGLRGIEIKLYRVNGPTDSVITDSFGRFDFRNLPAMQYNLSAPYDAVQGWIVEYLSPVVVDGTNKSETLSVRAERALSEVLGAKAEFGAKTYKPGDVATATVTLTNKGTKTLSGIKAGCDRYGSEAHLSGPSDQEHFGDLGYNAPGATLAAGETRAFEVHGDVLQGAQDDGVVYLACDFGDDERYLSGFPTADAHAKVPGKTADLGGVVYQDFNGNDTVDPGEAIQNLRLGLTEWEADQVVATTTTDFNGVAQFIRLPRGWYSPVVYGPWKIVAPEKLTNPMQSTDHFAIKVLPGPDNPDPAGTPPTGDSVPPADGGSGSGSGSSGGLASTGVEVFGPAVGGAAAVFAGILALFYARRLRRNEV